MRVKSEARRQAIIEGAAKVFLEHGYESTSMLEIAARAGVSKPTLYSYFESKDELLLEVMKMLIAELMPSSFAQLQSDQDLPSCLQRFGEHFLAHVLQPDLVTLRGIIMTEGRRSDIGARLYEKGWSQEVGKLAAFLQQAMAAGHLRPANPATAAAHLLGMLESEYQDYLLGATAGPAQPQHISRTVQDAVDVFLRGYAPAPKAAQLDVAAYQKYYY
ncbi:MULTISPECIES: TetR/AcrR family transcriptional regulator [Aquitalea]|uniref:TetR family transcriptional regulator n=1 Tax=Aquitalea magnusonii TaxID=332411 RepID=A0A318J9Z2_9NEIS|nr:MULTISPECIES: TetR/AcrR family transcriptional regulator [Aquitalea]PXX43377.1 TetR family transcriptional regulator [Aquitalea magnusonii]